MRKGTLLRECLLRRKGGMSMFDEIRGSDGWLSVEKIEKGWSSDEKYHVRTRDGRRLQLRISAPERYAAKKKEYEIIEKFSSLGFPMSEPVEFGRCAAGTYMLLIWVEGDDLEKVLPLLPEKEQYRLGCEAGGILRRIHSLPLEAADVPEGTKKEKKLCQLKRYEASDVRIPGDEGTIAFVRENIDAIWTQPPVYLHGDFHPGNLVYRRDGSLGVIDFNRWEAGDPYEEFYKLECFGVEASTAYCAGQIDAYFAGNVPESFWKALAVYSAHASLFSIVWAEPFGEKDVSEMKARAARIIRDYDFFRTPVPKWYSEITCR